MFIAQFKFTAHYGCVYYQGESCEKYLGNISLIKRRRKRRGYRAPCQMVIYAASAELLLTNICVWAFPTVCFPLCLNYRVCATHFLGRFICIYGSAALPLVRLSGFHPSQGYTPSLSPDRTCSHRSGSAWPHIIRIHLHHLGKTEGFI